MRDVTPQTEGEPGAPRALAPPLWEGKPYPTPPDVPDSSRQRPAPTSITRAAIDSAEADHAALPAASPAYRRLKSSEPTKRRSSTRSRPM